MRTLELIIGISKTFLPLSPRIPATWIIIIKILLGRMTPEKRQKLSNLVKATKAASVNFNFYSELTANSFGYRCSKKSVRAKGDKSGYPLDYISQAYKSDELVDVLSYYFFYYKFINTYCFRLSSFLSFDVYINNPSLLKKKKVNRIRILIFNYFIDLFLKYKKLWSFSEKKAETKREKVKYSSWNPTKTKASKPSRKKVKSKRRKFIADIFSISGFYERNLKTSIFSYLVVFFLRKVKIFNKGRYSRNRQNYRTGVYLCLWLSIVLIVFVYYIFYRFMFNFGFIWIIFFIFVSSFFFSRFIQNYKLSFSFFFEQGYRFYLWGLSSFFGRNK